MEKFSSLVKILHFSDILIPTLLRASEEAYGQGYTNQKNPDSVLMTIRRKWGQQIGLRNVRPRLLTVALKERYIGKYLAEN